MTSEEQRPGPDEWRPWERPAEARHGDLAAARTEPVPVTPEPAWAGQDATSGPGARPAPPGHPGPDYAVPTYGTPYGGPAHDPDPSPAARAGDGRRRPGWGALLGATVAASLVAGTAGGLVGASLAEDRRPGGSGSSTSGTGGPRPGAGATARPEGSIANIAATVTPSVVTLRVEGTDGSGTGSGWVYDDQGHIVTNNHVVAGAAESGEITAVLADGKQAKGRIVGRDASYDLAVVKLDRTDLAPLELGRSADVVVGDQVIAVGAPLGLDSTVTTGIVSALDRPVTPGEDDDQSFISAIQTDAAINPGNSGGPLLDMNGRVIGVNTAIARVPGSGLGGSSGNIGVGFAIPSDQVAKTVEQLIATGEAEHPVIGVYLDSSYDGEGVRIADSGPSGAPAVDPDGPAAAAGLRAGDVIVAFEGRPVSEQGELVVAIRARSVGEEVTLTVRRGGTDRDVTMVLQGSDD